MALRVALTHRTRYQYDRPVMMSPHILRLRPAPHCRTPIHSYSLRVKPEKHFINWQQDPFGNFLARYVFPELTSEFAIEVDLVAEMTVINPFDFFVDSSAETFPFAYDDQSRRELLPYLEIREAGQKLLAWIEKVPRDQPTTIDFLVHLNQLLQREISYLIRMEPGVQSCEETLTTRSGSCRDSAWLLVQILRHLGFAARFVSGYLVQLQPDEKPLDGPAGPVSDFTDLHAWAEAFVPGAGWVGLDPTSGLFAGEGHIPLACTPDPQSAAPVSGATDRCEVEFFYSNEVTRVHEDPRTTRPYRIEQWEAIDRLGGEVDNKLRELDVRLTMGGEPTFVSIDNLAAPEWNTAAMGPQKRKLADQLLRRLAERFGSGAVLHHGQGKWYPGEELPRWAFSAFWRKDGLAIWRNPEQIAADGRDYGADAVQAERFARELAKRLRVNPDHAQPAWEDAFYYLWREQNLPSNVDPLKADLKDPLERRRIARLLEAGLGNVVGYALPLRWSFDYGREGWESGPWDVRRGRMYLLPGDSPMGYRLPLSSLVHTADELRDPFPEVCPSDPRPRLPDFATLVQQRYAETRSTDPAIGEGLTNQSYREQRIDAPDGQSSAFPGYGRPGDPIVRTALCLEPRQGRLHLFLPPLSHLEHFLDLMQCIEQTSAELSIPVVLEGYPPPYDPRIHRLAVTPDPGVIEVNLHPAANWTEVVNNTTTLYEEARQCGLTTQKHLLDGRLTGTGGGNHITIGGQTVTDSPMLRRPDLLKSLITCWQNHPSLSYLFSGLFIGPTSQMPRIDEARHEGLYELGLAFDHMRTQENLFPWTVDRMLRHLLVDLTGNTHRAEFCIDKLYSPDSLSGRLGLLEMRGFEMPPHARMSAVQQLLLRSMIAAFWKSPYDQTLVPWGTELHDRFMLPEYVWSDFREVIDELNRRGYPLELDWFRPFFEFRFPIYGDVSVDGIDIEIRMALEPWHVLGEEASAGGTSRYVDSSVERVQVKVRGLTETRHLVLCNGRVVPLRSTRVQAEQVAGVRFRAWQPPSCLHPLVPVHSPLVFDLYDLWTERSLGGCTYHVAHPGGRNFEDPPVNAQAAESRRLARFWPYGHTPGHLPVPKTEYNPDFPYTLDLRRVP